MKDEYISRQAAIDAAMEELDGGPPYDIPNKIMALPSARPQPEEDCATCKHGYFGDRQCDNCRARYPSHYEREEEHHGSH